MWYQDPKVRAVIKKIVEVVSGDRYDDFYVIDALMDKGLVICEGPEDQRAQIAEDIKREFDWDNEEYGQIVREIIHLVEHGELPG